MPPPLAPAYAQEYSIKLRGTLEAHRGAFVEKAPRLSTAPAWAYATDSVTKEFVDGKQVSAAGAEARAVSHPMRPPNPSPPREPCRTLLPTPHVACMFACCLAPAPVAQRPTLHS